MKKKKKGCLYGLWNSFLIVVCLVVIVYILNFVFKTDIFYKTRYPLVHNDIVEKYSDLYDVDKYLVYSIIRTESFFDEEAISPKGAVGLMQIMPDTANWIAEKNNIENFTNEDLFDCEKNIMMGVWYISFLTSKFEGNLDNAIAAYNAGPTNVGKWLSERKFSDDGKELNDIPFDETEEYVEKVKSAYDMYLKIYTNS